MDDYDMEQAVLRAEEAYLNSIEIRLDEEKEVDGDYLYDCWRDAQLND